MIDTDKYEGHTPAPWTVNVHKVGQDTSAIVIESSMTTHSNDVLAEVEVENDYALIDAQLIADAPLLLEEVKRLREGIAALVDKMTTTVHFYRVVDAKVKSYASSLKELIE